MFTRHKNPCLTISKLIGASIKAAFLLIFISVSFDIGVAMETPKEPLEASIIVSINPNATGAGMPAEEMLSDLGNKFIKQFFSEDLDESYKVTAEVSMIKRGKEDIRFELDILFLYRKTFTAVEHKVIFIISGDQHSVIHTK